MVAVPSPAGCSAVGFAGGFARTFLIASRTLFLTFGRGSIPLLTRYPVKTCCTAISFRDFHAEKSCARRRVSMAPMMDFMIAAVPSELLGVAERVSRVAMRPGIVRE